MDDVFQGTPLASVIQKYEGKPVDVVFDVEAQGGKEEEGINITAINRNINLVSSVLPQLKTLVNNIEIKHRVSNEVTKRHKTMVFELESLVDKIQKIVKDHRIVVGQRERKKLIRFTSDLHVKVENVRYFCKVLISTLDDGVSKKNAAPVIAELKRIATILPRVLYVPSNRFPASQTFHGFEIKIIGKMCAGKLCFENMNIGIKKDPDGLMIRGVATKNLKLGKVLSLSKGGEVIMKIQGKDNGANRVLFRPVADIFGIKQAVSAEIIGNSMNFNASGLLLERHEAVIQVKANTNVAKWNSLKFKVNGILNQNTSLIKELQTKINSRILELAEKANKRLKKAKNVAEKARQIVTVLKQVVKEKRVVLSKLEKQKQRRFLAWRLADSNYWNFTLSNSKHTKSSGISRRSVHDDSPCQIKKCSTEKIESERLETKYEQRYTKITIRECDGYKDEYIKKEKVVSTKRVKSYTIPRYENRVVSSCFKANWMIGAVAGGVSFGLVGLAAAAAISSTVVAVPFVILGVAIGAVIGSLIDLFGGCKAISIPVRLADKTVNYYDIKYERKVFLTKIKVRNCYNKQVEVPSGYEPHIERITTFINVPNIKCIESNKRCVKKLRSLPMINPEFKKLFERHKLINQVESARMKLDRAIWEQNKLKSELETAELRMLNSRKARDKAIKSIKELKNIKEIKTGLKISKSLGQWNPFEMAAISGIKFNSIYSGNAIGASGSFHLPITLTLSSAMANIWESFIFVPDFFNILSFLYNIFISLLVFLAHIVSRAGRIGRSLDMQPNIPLIDTNSSVLQKFTVEQEILSEKAINTSTLGINSKEDDCLMAKNGNEFFKDIVIQLRRQISNQEMISNTSGESEENSAHHALRNLKETAPKNISAAGVNDTEEMLDSYLDLIASVTEQNFSILSWNDTLNNWKSSLQELSEGNSFSYCAGALDCVQETGNKLHELYYYSEDLPRANVMKNLLPNITSEIIYLMEQNFTMNEAKEKIAYILDLLNRTDDDTILCGKKPVFNSTSNPQNQVVVEGESFVLECNANSDTPMRYTWIHNNETLYESVPNSVLKIENATMDQEGAYKCKAANHKGYVTSNVTLVEINTKPKITEHPNDIQVYTKDPTSTFLLNCNATGDPEPDIEWFFISQHPNASKVKIYNDNGSFLYYEKPTTSYSGYYYCQASNIHGRVESKRARVWVLDMFPGEPLLAAKINVTKTCKTNKRTLRCGTFPQSESNDQDDKDLRIIKGALGESMNTSQSQISMVMYKRNSKQSAMVVFLYKSDKPQEKEKSNDSDVDPVAQEYAKKRQQLAMGLQKLYQDVNNGLFNASSESEVIDADPKSLSLLDADTGCPAGQIPHANGYMCGT